MSVFLLTFFVMIEIYLVIFNPFFEKKILDRKNSVKDEYQ